MHIKGSFMCLDLSRKRVLLLQGPNGPFFQRLAVDLRARGCVVTKVNFNSGDDLFYRGPEVVRFRDDLEKWPEFFRTLVAERNIEAVMLFGDCRPIHQAAVRIARELDIGIWVLEEGYLRPDFVTIERGGVNGRSSLPADPEFYRRATAGLPELPEPVPLGNTFRLFGWWTTLNACAATFFWFRHPQYHHHRNIHAFRQAYYWVRGAARKGMFALEERGVLERLAGEQSDRYFLVPLQVHLDAQVRHSRFGSIERFLEEVVATFADHAPPDVLLVVKQHPLDRPYCDYRETLEQLGRRHGVAHRIIYVHDLHLPTLLKHARGVIAINSTVGMSALHHSAPLKVLGKAIYDIPGLTSQRSLAEFLVKQDPVDAELFRCFVRWLREENQINGSFYKRMPALGTACGLDRSVFGDSKASPDRQRSAATTA